LFLRSITNTTPEPLIRGSNVMLRLPAAGDYSQWAVLRSASREFLKPWEPRWPHGDLTRIAYKQRIRRYARDMRDDAAYSFFIFQTGSQALLGGLTASNVRRGVAQTASIGYWIGSEHAGKGHMSDAVSAFLPYAFQNLKLNRVEAACLPENTPSIRLLRRCGFTEEGYARSYLQIDGRWQDHLLFAIVAGDLRR